MFGALAGVVSGDSAGVLLALHRLSFPTPEYPCRFCGPQMDWMCVCGQVVFEFVRDPAKWEVFEAEIMPPETAACNDFEDGNYGICLQVVGAAKSLLQHMFERGQVSLVKAEIIQLIGHMGGSIAKNSKKDACLLKLIQLVFPELNEEECQGMLSSCTSKLQTHQERAADTLLKNPQLAMGLSMMRDEDPEAMKEFQAFDDVLRGEDRAPTAFAISKRGLLVEDEGEDEAGHNEDEDEDEPEPPGPATPGPATPGPATPAPNPGTPPLPPPHAEPPAEPPAASSSTSSSSSSSSSSSDSDADEPAQGSGGGAGPSEPKFTTPVALQPLVPDPFEQGIGQDFRENRFTGRDHRDAPGLDEDLRKKSHSKSYGGARTGSHQDALEDVLRWLWRKSKAFGGRPQPEGPLLPDPLPKGLQEALSAEVAKGYYKK